MAARSVSKGLRRLLAGLMVGVLANALAVAAVADEVADPSNETQNAEDHRPQSITVSWPSLDDLDRGYGEPVSFPTRNPFTLTHLILGIGEHGAQMADARLFMPDSASADAPVPAVVMLHGAGGVLPAREIAYARQLAASGVAVVVVDSFESRSELAGNSYAARIFRTTEMMMVADAYAALDYLAGIDAVDASRVALIGYSYGGMTSVIAAQAQVAEAASPDGRRFVAHASYYGPCIARFADRRTTGAPVLMLMGGQDAIVDPARCAEVVEDLRAGGSPVHTVFYEDALHQWDGGLVGPRLIGYNIAPCDLRIDRNGIVRDGYTGMPMTGPITRLAILVSCTTTDGFLVGRDDDIRMRSNAEVTRLLESVFNHPGRDPWFDHAFTPIPVDPNSSTLFR